MRRRGSSTLDSLRPLRIRGLYLAWSSGIKFAEVERVYTVDALIEIRKAAGTIRIRPQNRTHLFQPHALLVDPYPTNYGLIPNTLALDGDELDILVVTSEPSFPAVVVARPIGGLESDERGKTRRSAVPVGDLAIYVTGSAASHMLSRLSISSCVTRS